VLYCIYIDSVHSQKERGTSAFRSSLSVSDNTLIKTIITYFCIFNSSCFWSPENKRIYMKSDVHGWHRMEARVAGCRPLL